MVTPTLEIKAVLLLEALMLRVCPAPDEPDVQATEADPSAGPAFSTIGVGFGNRADRGRLVDHAITL